MNIIISKSGVLSNNVVKKAHFNLFGLKAILSPAHKIQKLKISLK